MLQPLLKSLESEFPNFKLVHKETCLLMRLVDIFLKIITFGGMHEFMLFTTVVGNTIYVPLLWEAMPDMSKAIILRHERVHMCQRRRLGVWFTLSYLLLPLPILFAYFRMKYEMEAYEESLRATVEYKGVGVLTPGLREVHIQFFTGPQYLWMWIFRKRVERWYDNFIVNLRVRD